MNLPSWLLRPQCYFLLIATGVFFSITDQALAGYVNAYSRKDGTFVNAYYRGSRGSSGSSSYTPSYQPSSLGSYGGSSYAPSYQPSSPGRKYGAKLRNGGGLGYGIYTSQVPLTGCRFPSDDEIKRAAKGMRVDISGGDCVFIINPKSQDRYRL